MDKQSEYGWTDGQVFSIDDISTDQWISSSCNLGTIDCTLDKVLDSKDKLISLPNASVLQHFVMEELNIQLMIQKKQVWLWPYKAPGIVGS